MIFPLVRDPAAYGSLVEVTNDVLGFSSQAHHTRRANPVGDRDRHDAHLVNMLVDAHEGDSEFGYRFQADEL
jgi:hypothetical protein